MVAQSRAASREGGRQVAGQRQSLVARWGPPLLQKASIRRSCQSGERQASDVPTDIRKCSRSWEQRITQPGLSLAAAFNDPLWLGHSPDSHLLPLPTRVGYVFSCAPTSLPLATYNDTPPMLSEAIFRSLRMATAWDHFEPPLVRLISAGAVLGPLKTSNGDRSFASEISDTCLFVSYVS